jgi:hypothetical protein
VIHIRFANWERRRSTKLLAAVRPGSLEPEGASPQERDVDQGEER